MGKHSQGISFVEVTLAIVLGIIIMLSTFGTYSSYKEDLKFKQARAIVQTVKGSLAFYQTQQTTYPPMCCAIGSLFSNNMNLTINNRLFYGDYKNATIKPFPADPYKYVNTIVAGTVATGPPSAGGWYYDQTTGTFGINLLDSEYGVNGTVKKLYSNPSTW